MLFLQPKLEYLINFKRILRCFELASGLRINFHKSCVVKVGKKLAEEEDWGRVFKCKKAILPISYLGLPIGARPHSKAFWNTLVLRMGSRLAPWKKKFLDKGGRLVLIKSVLSSISTYYMSVFKVSRSFFWGDGVEKRKVHAVDWGTICKRKSHGGLGIGRVLDINRSLLAKWVWRFGKEEGSMWKRVLCAKYGISQSSLSWKWKAPSSASVFMKAVGSLFDEGSVSASILEGGLKILVGCGDRIRFWEDVWLDDCSLKVAYPRIFALASKKSGTVRDFGSWQKDVWRWNVPLRRSIFDWEVNLWKVFCMALDCVTIIRIIPDVVVWTHRPNGEFSVKSFERCIEDSLSDGQVDVVFSWGGITPHKVEVFIWQLIRGWVMVNQVLDRFGMLVAASLECSLCRESLESIDHLFLHCSWALRVWYKCMGWWDVVGCCNSSLKEWFSGWMGLCPKVQYGRAWSSLIQAIGWSLWEARNRVVFKGISADVNYVIDLVKFRVAWWFKHHGKGSTEPITLMLENLKECCTKCALGRAGIGGVLCDARGKVLCLFSAFVGARDAIAAEMLAIQKAINLYASKTTFVGRDIVIVSDSKSAVDWVNESGIGHINLVDSIYDIRSKLDYLGNTKVIYNSRATNLLVDSLAKKGLASTGEFIKRGEA
ncbi:hypothetical protein Dsin_017787 [Dipteronia sinensis]|uniref:Uncharacterized protein n=1 Tax=Dipteronia sinensis TaxID=43782 RepID=A0AAE0E6S1_9ROSI|nr:hypothetical protein Dsin_017787 [Dipteronia sinensis]